MLCTMLKIQGVQLQLRGLQLQTHATPCKVCNITLLLCTMLNMQCLQLSLATCPSTLLVAQALTQTQTLVAHALTALNDNASCTM